MELAERFCGEGEAKRAAVYWLALNGWALPGNRNHMIQDARSAGLTAHPGRRHRPLAARGLRPGRRHARQAEQPEQYRHQDGDTAGRRARGYVPQGHGGLASYRSRFSKSVKYMRCLILVRQDLRARMPRRIRRS